MMLLLQNNPPFSSMPSLYLTQLHKNVIRQGSFKLSQIKLSILGIFEITTLVL